MRVNISAQIIGTCGKKIQKRTKANVSDTLFTEMIQHNINRGHFTSLMNRVFYNRLVVLSGIPAPGIPGDQVWQDEVFIANESWRLTRHGPVWRLTMVASVLTTPGNNGTDSFWPSALTFIKKLMTNCRTVKSRSGYDVPDNTPLFLLFLHPFLISLCVPLTDNPREFFLF
jgi:hypothetical protein